MPGSSMTARRSVAKFKLTLAHLEVLRRAPLDPDEPWSPAAAAALTWKLLRWDAGARSDGDGGWIQVKEIPAAVRLTPAGAAALQAYELGRQSSHDND